MSSRITYILVMLSFVLILVYNIIPSSHNTQNKFIGIGTASMSGVYYPVGGIICKMVNNMDQHIKCSVQSTPGTVYNINALRNNDIDIGMAQADSEYNAYQGMGLFKEQKPIKELRTLFLLHHDVFTVLARKDANISTFDDIKHKRVNIGLPGTGVQSTIRELMNIKNWSIDDFKIAAQLKSSEQAQALCDNKIDVTIDMIGHPSGSVQEASATCETVMIPIDQETIKKLIDEHAYYERYTVPGGMYSGTDSDISTFAVRTSVLSTKDVDEEIIYQVVKAAFTGFKALKSSRPVFKDLTKKNMVGINTAPLHDGAKKYYKEVGLL